LSTDFSHRNLRAIADHCGQHAAERRNIDRDEDWTKRRGDTTAGLVPVAAPTAGVAAVCATTTRSFQSGWCVNRYPVPQDDSFQSQPRQSALWAVQSRNGSAGWLEHAPETLARAPG